MHAIPAGIIRDYRRSEESLDSAISPWKCSTCGGRHHQVLRRIPGHPTLSLGENDCASLDLQGPSSGQDGWQDLGRSPKEGGFPTPFKGLVRLVQSFLRMLFTAKIATGSCDGGDHAAGLSVASASEAG